MFNLASGDQIVQSLGPLGISVALSRNTITIRMSGQQNPQQIKEKQNLFNIVIGLQGDNHGGSTIAFAESSLSLSLTLVLELACRRSQCFQLLIRFATFSPQLHCQRVFNSEKPFEPDFSVSEYCSACVSRVGLSTKHGHCLGIPNLYNLS